MKCKYKFQDKEKFKGMTYCTLFNELYWIYFVQGVKTTELTPKTEEFYRIILFNYLLRKAQFELKAGNQ